MPRQKVADPFRQKAERPRYQPDLVSRALPRAAYQPGPDVGTQIVDTLVSFAGVAGTVYMKETAKKLETDKAIQSARATQGLAPTDTATVAGYRAHAAVNLQSESLASQARLNELAMKRTTDEEWEKAIQAEFKTIDDRMMETYPNYDKDIEMQQLSAVALREVVPKATRTREQAKLEFEIQDRVSTATDSLINGSKAGELDLQNTEHILGALKLTESQKDKVLINAAINSNDPTLMAMTKEYKGVRKTSLYERTGSLQALDRRQVDKALSANAIDLAVEIRGLEESMISGESTEAEFTARVKSRNKELNGGFMTGSQYTSILNKVDKQKAANFRQRKIIADVADPTKVDMGGYKKQEVQGALNAVFENEMSRVEESTVGLDPSEAQTLTNQGRHAAIARVGDMAVKSGEVLDVWVGELNNLANMNVPANILEMPVDEFQVDQLPPMAQKAIEKLDSLSLTAGAKFIEALGSREGKVIRHFQNLRDMGTPLPQALAQAQRDAKNPTPRNAKVMQKAIKSVRSDQEFWWWRPDFKDNQEAYLEGEIYKKLDLDPMPDSERNINVVNDWLKNEWTVAGGLRLKGSPQNLQKSTGINVDKLRGSFDAALYSEKGRILPQLSGGLGIKDVFPVTDVKRGTFRFTTNSGAWLGPPRPLADLRKIANKHKVAMEKEVTQERIDRVNELKLGGF